MQHLLRLFILLALLTSCGDSPNGHEVVEITEDAGPAWCSADAGVIEGRWGREFEFQGHEYQSSLRFTREDHCTYSYRLEHWLVDPEHENTMIFLTTGVVVVVEVEWMGEIAGVTAEAKMTYRGEAPRTGGDGPWKEKYGTVLYSPNEFKVWGDNAVFWDQQFTR